MNLKEPVRGYIYAILLKEWLYIFDKIFIIL